MNHPLDKGIGDLMKAASEGPEAMEDWIKDLQKKVGAPDGPELPDSIELEYADGTKETLNTTLPQFYNHDNPMPQDMLDSIEANAWALRQAMTDRDEDEK